MIPHDAGHGDQLELFPLPCRALLGPVARWYYDGRANITRIIYWNGWPRLNAAPVHHREPLTAPVTVAF